jgi:hypothetical protein
MRHLSVVLLILALPALAADEAKPVIAMGEPVALSFAGITLALPKECVPQRIDDASVIIQAAKMENGAPTLGMSVSATLQEPKQTLDGFVDAAHPTDPGVKNFKVLKASPLQAGGVSGTVQILTYTYRGADTTGLRLFFLRPLADKSAQMGYVVSLESERAMGKLLLPTLTAIISTIQLSEPARWSPEKMTLDRVPIASAKLGYSICAPLWWKVKPLPPEREKVEMFQTDYTRGQIPIPYGSFLAEPTVKTPEQIAAFSQNGLVDEIRKQKGEAKVLSQNPVTMDGRPGYEFIVRQTVAPATQPATAPATTAPANESIIIGQRVVCANGYSYSFIVLGMGEDGKDVAATLDKLSTGLKLTAIPTTQPAPASNPAP